MKTTYQYFSRFTWLTAFLLTTLVTAGCYHDDDNNNDVQAGRVPTVPTVLSSNPSDTATGVTINGNIRVVFSEPMDAATINAVNFTLRAGTKAVAGAAVPGAVSFEAASNTATFDPTGDLTANTVYTVTVTKAATSALNVALASDYVWTFTTDLSTPVVAFVSPGDVAPDVAVNHQVIVTFSEPMNGATIDASSFTLMAQGETAVVGTVSFDIPSNTAAFVPGARLAPATRYTATLTTAVTSSSGRALASNYVWSFTTLATPDVTAPLISATYPLDTAVNFALNRNITADFNETLAPATVNALSFTLAEGVNPVAGVVSYSGTRVTFNPNSDLTASTLYTATLTTAITDLASPANALANNYVWTFTTSAVAAVGPAPVNLGSAGNFVILTKTGTTNVHTSAITGNLGASPITAAAMDNVFCTEITGTIYGADAAYTGSGAIPCFAGAAPDNTLVANAVLDMGIAYNDAAGRSLPDFTELHAGDISGQTLIPGLYKWSSGVLISTDVTLSGGANDVWIFQISGDITQANASRIILAGGAQAKNIFWQVEGGTGVALGTTAHFAGIILAAKGITVNTGATVNGRLFAHTAVTLDQNAITQPAP